MSDPLSVQLPMGLSAGPECASHPVSLLRSGFAQNNRRANAGGRVLHKKSHPHLFVQPLHTKLLQSLPGNCSSSSGHQRPERGRTGPLPVDTAQLLAGSMTCYQMQLSRRFQATLFSNRREQINGPSFLSGGHLLPATALSNGFVPPDQSCH